MKVSILKTSFIFLLFSLVWAGCEKENEFSDFVEGYIVASFRCGELDPESGQGTGEPTTRGFFIMLENQSDSMYTFSIQETLFDFPEEILKPNHNIKNCGPVYFVNSQEYKIKFKYKNSNESEKIKFVCGPCTSMDPAFDWDAFKQVVINEIEIK